MDNIQTLFAVVVLLTIFLSTEIVVLASREPYLMYVSDNLTEVVKNSDVVFQPNDTWSEAYLSLCCPLGKARLKKNCVDDNTAADPLPIGDFQLLIDDPCAFNWMASSVSEDFYVLPNGTIYALNIQGASHFDFENYCLFREPKSTVYLARVCKPWIEKVYWQIWCLVFALLVMVGVLIVYSMVPELGNLHGLVFRAYIIGYIACHVGVIGQQLTSGSRTYDFLFIFFVFSLHYSAGCCALWLNVMSFNIWRSFRSLRSIDSYNREYERKKFIWYAIYACLTPALFNSTTAALMLYIPYFQKLPLNNNIILWGCAGLLTTVILCNTILYTMTALKINQHEKETSHFTNGVNKHQEADKQWFNLHVKLFLVTGCHTIMWIIWELYPARVTTCLMVILEVVQSILIFVIFIWKGNVRRSLRKQFDVTLNRLKHTFGTDHSTPTTKSGII